MIEVIPKGDIKGTNIDALGLDNKGGKGIVLHDGDIEMKVPINDIIPLAEKLARAYLRLMGERIIN